jgi:peptidoglycan/xylan/chitin deacetylase (PgdA/CDA1 family)
VIFLALDETLRLALQLLGFALKPRVVGLFYHQVARHERTRFAHQMESLLRLAKPLRTGETAPLAANNHYVFVTADDGWQSFIDNALPELHERDIPVTIFVISGQLGQTPSTDGDRIVDEPGLRAINNGLVTIGSHTQNHSRLTAAGRANALWELNASRAILREITGAAVDLFCFPFGSHDPDLVEMCRATGYRRVFKSTPAFTSDDRHEFLVGRVRVDPSDWPIEFHLKMLGAYRWLPAAIAVKRRLSEWLTASRYLTAVRE